MPDPVQPTLAQTIGEQTILVHPEAEEREAVVKSLVRSLADAGRLQQTQMAAVLRSIHKREELGSTAIGGGVALPHARMGFLDEVLAAMALLKSGKGFQPLDGEPVRFVFLVLTPKDNDPLHVAFLKSITAFTNVTMHRNALKSCKTPAEVHGVLEDYG